MKTFEYTVLRFVPDRRRGEIINIGVAIFLADRIDVRISTNLNKVKAVDPNTDIEYLYQLPELINGLLEGVTDNSARLIMLEGLGAVHTTKLGYFSVDRAINYDQEVESLLRDLVVSPGVVKKRLNKASRFTTTLKKEFKKQELLGTKKDIDNHMIVYQYPIAAEENVYADFVLKNSHWHVTETIDLNGTPETIRGDKFKQACVKAITLERAVKRLGDCLPVVVYAADDRTLEQTDYHRKLLADSAEKIYNYLDPNDKAAYFKYITEAAGHQRIQ